RKNRAGENFLTEAEFLAGERLRSDYTRGQIMPRLGANWEASVSSGPRGGDDGFAKLTDAALSARIRVDKALEAVGPELAGPLIDICCFLKGLSQVETERGWPARSAKLLLKTALAALSRHYEPVTTTRRQNVLPWGSRDYKPSLQRNCGASPTCPAPLGVLVGGTRRIMLMVRQSARTVTASEFHMSAKARFLDLPGPRAEQRPVVSPLHGHTRIDEYAWLRADNWQDVLRDPA